MSPDSVIVPILLLLFAVGLMVLLVRTGHLWVKLVAGTVSMLLAAVTGMAVVNDYYGYYATWGQLTADLSGNYSAFGTTPTGSRAHGQTLTGQVQHVTLPGPRSGISRSGLVYLPPQYFQPEFRHTTFPVAELVHGTPGTPNNWVVQLRLAQVMDTLVSDHRIGPMIVVMPTMSVGHDYQECVDAPGALDDTYMTDDVRADVLAHYRASTDPSEWAIGGYSSGGYCAANLALRHPAEFGASGIMDGYFRPTDGPAARALHHDAAAEQANNPLAAASSLSTGAHPLPAFWVEAGSGDAGDMAAADAFVRALHGVEQVTLYREPGAGHNFDAWRPAFPRMLAWMWTQLAPPALRVRFPISGPVTNSTLPKVGKPAPTQGASSTPTRHPSAPPATEHAPSARTPSARTSSARTPSARASSVPPSPTAS